MSTAAMSTTVTAFPVVALHRGADTSCCLHLDVSAVLLRRLCESRALAHAHLDVAVASCAVPGSGTDGDEPTSAVVSMFGDLTVDTVDEVVWQSVVDYATFARWVVVDLSRAEHVDGRGTALVNALHRATTAVGGNVTVHDPDLVVEYVLRCCGLSDGIAVCHPFDEPHPRSERPARLDRRTLS